MFLLELSLGIVSARILARLTSAHESLFQTKTVVAGAVHSTNNKFRGHNYTRCLILCLIIFLLRYLVAYTS